MKGRALGLALAALLSSRAARADEPARAIADPAGVPVTFTSTDKTMHVYLAHGNVPAGAIPDPFEKQPLLPVTVRLAPGQYTVEAESVTASTGHDVIYVSPGAPMTVEVRAGNASLKLLGGIGIALGVVASVLGVVAIVSLSSHDSGYDRWAVGVPLVAGGATVAGVGIGLTVLGSTDIRAPHLPPGGAPVRAVALGVQF